MIPHEQCPPAGSDSGRRPLDPVAGDRAAARGGGPAQLDARRSPGPGHEARRSPRRAARRGARLVRPVPLSMPVDRRDPVVPGGAGRETLVPVVGIPVVGFEDIPDNAGGRPLDPVARDRRASRIARRPPVQLDHRRAVGVGRQIAGRSGGCVVRRGGVHHGRPGPVADGVPCPDPVVVGRARSKTRVCERGNVGVGAPQKTPSIAAVRRLVDLVFGDCAPAVRGRRVPVELNDRRASSRRIQVPGCTQEPGHRRGGVRVRRGPEGVVGVQRLDLVVVGPRRETRMLVLGPANSRQLPKVDAAIRRHVHPVTADRLPGGR